MINPEPESWPHYCTSPTNLCACLPCRQSFQLVAVFTPTSSMWGNPGRFLTGAHHIDLISLHEHPSLEMKLAWSRSIRPSLHCFHFQTLQLYFADGKNATARQRIGRIVGFYFFGSKSCQQAFLRRAGNPCRHLARLLLLVETPPGNACQLRPRSKVGTSCPPTEIKHSAAGRRRRRSKRGASRRL